MDTEIDISRITPTGRLPSGLDTNQAVITGAQQQSGNGMPAWAPTTELNELADVDAGLITELLSLFLADSGVRLQTLCRARADLDFRVLRAQAHSLKGSALQMGAAGLAALCAELELSEGPGTKQRDILIQAICDEFVLVRRAMEGYTP